MSVTPLRYCPDPECRFNTFHVYADYDQIKRHLWEHSYKQLIKIAWDLNLIPANSYADKNRLVGLLSKLSRVKEFE